MSGSDQAQTSCRPLAMSAFSRKLTLRDTGQSTIVKK
jgi:hypothetical protein